MSKTDVDYFIEKNVQILSLKRAQEFDTYYMYENNDAYYDTNDCLCVFKLSNIGMFEGSIPFDDDYLFAINPDVNIGCLWKHFSTDEKRLIHEIINSVEIHEISYDRIIFYSLELFIQILISYEYKLPNFLLEKLDYSKTHKIYPSLKVKINENIRPIRLMTPRQFLSDKWLKEDHTWSEYIYV